MFMRNNSGKLPYLIFFCCFIQVYKKINKKIGEWERNYSQQSVKNGCLLVIFLFFIFISVIMDGLL